MKAHALTAPPPHAGRRGALLGLLGLGALLPACTSLLGSQPQAPLTHYALERGPPAAPAAGASSPSGAGAMAMPVASAVPVGPYVLLLAAPQAAPGYDSARMVYQRQPHTLEAFTQSAWVDTPARMLSPLLLQSLQESAPLRSRVRAVLQAPSNARADLLLETGILRLQQDFLQQPSRVYLTLQATLTDQRTREVLAWRRLEVTQVAASDDAAGGAAAASAAVQTALQQLVRFVQSSVAALPPLQAAVSAP